MQKNRGVETAPFAYLWTDEPKWTVRLYYDAVVRVSVRLASSQGPAISELRALRVLSPELATLEPAMAKQKIGHGISYFLGEYGRMEGKQVADRGRELGLNIEETVTEISHFVPVRFNGNVGPVIDDKVLARYVMRKMIDAGCPIAIVEID